MRAYRSSMASGLHEASLTSARGGGTRMLRIDIHEEGEVTSFGVEGKLTRRCVKELEDCWKTALSSLPRKSIQVNLSAVTFIDAEGKELLTRMRRQGAVLVPTGCFMKVIVEEIEAELSQE
jgi:ABC-type transporter Mla MlaB component